MITAKEKNIIKNALYGIDYEKIILFGSRARGDNRTDSDFDLMIVFKNDITRDEKMKLTSLIIKRLVMDDIDCDVLIRSETQINNLKNRTGSITGEVVREGYIL